MGFEPMSLAIKLGFVDGTHAILDIYLGIVEPAVGRSQSMYHLQNPVNGQAPFRVLVAQLVEHPPGFRKPHWALGFFFPSLCMFQLFL